MKKLIYASGLLVLMAAATSCEKYDIYPEQFDSVFTIRDAGTKDVTLYATDEQVEYPIIIMKGGYDPEVKSTATLKVMNLQEFNDYNASLGTLPYILVGNECYSFSADKDSVYSQTYDFFNADKKAETAHLYIRPNAINRWIDENKATIEYGKLTPVIPVTLVSETDTVNSYGNITLLKVDVVTPQLTIDVNAGVIPSIVNLQTMPADSIFAPAANFSIPCENSWGFTLNLLPRPKNSIPGAKFSYTNEDLVEDYNDQFGTSLRPLPDDLFELVDTLRFAPGVTSLPLDLKIKIDPKRLNLNRSYAVAVTFNPENPIAWHDSVNNPGSALGFNKDHLMIFTVRLVNNVELKKVNLTASMVTGNDVEATEGSIANLFDGSTDTYFHSSWTAAKDRESTYGSYLEITLPEAMSAFRFNIANRNSAAAAGYIKKVRLYGSNDQTTWTQICADIDNMNTSLNGPAVRAEFGSDDDPFTNGNEYKYLRFCVMESGGGALTAPSTAIFWHASEFELYGN